MFIHQRRVKGAMPRNITFIFNFILLWAIAVEGQTAKTEPDSCRNAVEQAQTLYYEGTFDEAIQMIRPCLEKNVSDDSLKLNAYKILTQAVQAKGNVSAAKRIARSLLEQFPDYRPTIDQEPPQFVELIEEEREKTLPKTIEQKKGIKKAGGWNHWYWIGAGGAAVIGTGIYLFLQGDDKSDEQNALPLPPDWPDNHHK